MFHKCTFYDSPFGCRLCNPDRRSVAVARLDTRSLKEQARDPWPRGGDWSTTPFRDPACEDTGSALSWAYDDAVGGGGAA